MSEVFYQIYLCYFNFHKKMYKDKNYIYVAIDKGWYRSYQYKLTSPSLTTFTHSTALKKRTIY